MFYRALLFLFLFVCLLFFNDFIYGCAGSSCCMGFSLAAASRGCSPVGGRGLFSSCGEQGLLSSGGWGVWASHHGGSSCCEAWALVPTDLFCGSWAREPRPSGCDAWAQLLCHVWSSQTRGGTHVPCFGGGQFFTTELPGKPSGIF